MSKVVNRCGKYSHLLKEFELHLRDQCFSSIKSPWGSMMRSGNLDFKIFPLGFLMIARFTVIENMIRMSYV